MIPCRRAVVVWLVAWAGGQVAAAVVAVATDSFSELTSLVAALVTVWAIWIAAVVWAAADAGDGDIRRPLALSARWADLAALLVGVATQLVLVPGLYVALRAIWPTTFTPDRLTETAERLIDMTSDRWSAVVLIALVVLGAPLVEEIVYRGLLQRSIDGWWQSRSNPAAPPPGGWSRRSWFAVVVTAAWFAAIHFRPIEYPGLFLAGLVFGLCLAATGRLGTPILAHVGFNAAGLAMAWS